MKATISPSVHIGSILFLILKVTILFISCSKEKVVPEKSGLIEFKKDSDLPSFVGRGQCIECHQRENNLWIGSDHDLAMQEVNEETVLGDFNDAKFTHFGITSTFYRKNGKYYINTEGPDGKQHDYQIQYVFGIRPLQQYLIEFPDGRYQMLPLCWDTRPIDAGGQRWFHIYPDERIDKDDELYWTSMNQNWNYMCSECHSTNVKKNYDHKTETYNTAWSEIDVSCEACHGPGAEHIAWAKLAEKGQSVESYKNMGLRIQLKDPNKGTWVFRKQSKNAERTNLLESQAQIEMCARCHARRTLIDDNYQYGQSILNTHRVQLLHEGYYFADGQILEEVYVYGSFLQSKMYQKGVVCSDCHEPHSGKTYVQGNALCYRCHLQESYGTREHHFHHPDSSGASCVDCHMPERTYMVVDPRRDHSIRNPRPDLSLEMGVPNACNKCHLEKSVPWAAEYTSKWYGEPDQKKVSYGRIFHAAHQELPGAGDNLIHLAADSIQNNIIRATALSMLRRYPVPTSLPVIKVALQDRDPLIRFGALQALEILQSNDRFNLAKHLLNDPIKVVRVEAASVLRSVSQTALSSAERASLNKAINEYIQVQLFNGDRASSYLNLAVVYMQQGYFDKAEKAYQKAIALEPYFLYAYLNFADLYRGQGREEESEAILREALKVDPQSPEVRHALGLSLTRQKRMDEAVVELKQAVALRPVDPGLNYVYAIALNSTGKSNKALAVLKTALEFRPTNRDLLFALTTISRDNRDISEAIKYAEKLVEYWPYEKSYRQLLQQLRSWR